MSWKKDSYYLLRSIELAEEALELGSEPFGAVLVDKEGNIIMEQRNETKEKGETAHAEKELAVKASLEYDKEFLWECTLICNVEPCAMCAGTIYWSNIGSVKYALAEKELSKMLGGHAMDLPVRDLIAKTSKNVAIEGPFEEVEIEARKVLDKWISKIK